jgi:hypothetical protein
MLQKVVRISKSTRQIHIAAGTIFRLKELGLGLGLGLD